MSFWVLVAVAWLALAVHAVTVPARAASWFDEGLYNALNVLACVVLLARALLRRAERGVWLAVTAACVAWVAGDIYYAVAFGDGADVPFPSWSDVGYLGFFPFAYIALILLVRSRVTRLTRSVWLDGLTATFATAAVGASVILQPVLHATTGSTALVVTNLTYPVADTLLLAIVAGVFAVTGWRPGTAWILIGGSLAASAAADTLYLARTATGSYDVGTMLDALWVLSMLLLAAAAWAPRRVHLRRTETQALVAPILLGALAIALVLYDHFQHENAFVAAATAATLLCLMARAGLVVTENRRLLARSRHEAFTDALTGLGNRRKLSRDAEQRMEESDTGFVLALFDLDGFKGYNDRFGHPAGDALLERLGARLEALTRAVGGSAYRMGGDEFCAILPPGPDARTTVAQCRAALSEEGDGFSVTAACGWATAAELTTLDETLRLVDQRLYANKNSSYVSALSQTRDVLRRVVHERLAMRENELADVVDLAALTATELGVADAEIELTRLTAELRDIGKTAIPDAILDKPGPLDPGEWEYVREHAAIGERIVGSAPALERVAHLVRSTHERVDGTGYPDGLTLDEIPLPARVVAVVDAFDAMTRTRPHAPARSVEEAVAELDRCAGTQFDADVVSAFTTVAVRLLLERTSATAAAAA